MYTETSGSKSNSDDPCECPGITTCSTTSRSMRWRTQSSPQPDEMSILLCPFQTESEHTGMRAEGYTSPAQGYSVCSWPPVPQLHRGREERGKEPLSRTNPTEQTPPKCQLSTGNSTASQRFFQQCLKTGELSHPLSWPWNLKPFKKATLTSEV